MLVVFGVLGFLMRQYRLPDRAGHRRPDPRPDGGQPAPPCAADEPGRPDDPAAASACRPCMIAVALSGAAGAAVLHRARQDAQGRRLTTRQNQFLRFSLSAVGATATSGTTPATPSFRLNSFGVGKRAPPLWCVRQRLRVPRLSSVGRLWKTCEFVLALWHSRRPATMQHASNRSHPINCHNQLPKETPPLNKQAVEKLFCSRNVSESDRHKSDSKRVPGLFHQPARAGRRQAFSRCRPRSSGQGRQCPSIAFSGPRRRNRCGARSIGANRSRTAM